MSIVQMSLSASVLIMAIVLIRALTLHKLPKKTFLVLWGVAVFRLLVPISVPSDFSFYTGINMIKRIFLEGPPESYSAGIAGILNVASITGEPIRVSAKVDASTLSFSPFEIIWLTVMCACALFFIVAYIKFCREFRMSLPVGNDFVARWLGEHPLRRFVQIRQSDRIKTPLTYGIFHPVILLPKKMDWTDEKKLQYVLTHEFVHIRRFDTLTKLLLTIVVCVHWFNPFVWLMYVLINRDIELSCDETVVRKLGETIKSDYALTLIELEEKKRHFIPLISSFGRNAIEERIVSIMKIKKLSVLASMLAMILVVAVTTAFATTASTTPSTQDAMITKKNATIIPSLISDGTHFDVKLIKGSVLIMGRETWNKGDEIVFNIRADEDMELGVGILPAMRMDNEFGYNDYGYFNQKKIDVDSGVLKVSFVVPETGEYGIGVQHFKNETDKVSTVAPGTPEIAASSTPEINTSHISDEKGVKTSNEDLDPASMVSFEIEINKVFENPLVK